LATPTKPVGTFSTNRYVALSVTVAGVPVRSGDFGKMRSFSVVCSNAASAPSTVTASTVIPTRSKLNRERSVSGVRSMVAVASMTSLPSTITLSASS